MKLIRPLLSTILVGYLILGLLLFIFQRNFLYFPSPEYNHQYPSQTFHNEGESIKLIVLNEGKEKAILYFGGNGEAVVNNASDFIKTFPNHTVYLVNYRGYGGSSGFPEEQSILSDALYIYDEIKAKYTGISVIGRSLGTGVATYIASNKNVDKMILITPYDSIENIAQSQYPIFPVSVLLKDKFDSLSRVNQIKARTLIILASHDRVIPVKNSTNLINAFPVAQVNVKTIANSGHNSLSGTKEYHEFLGEFLNSYF